MSGARTNGSIGTKSMTLVVILAAIASRIYLYTSAPSLWDDEIFLSLGVIVQPLGTLVRKLDFQQFAPLGFVGLQRIAVDIAGVGERSLRLVPFLAGCLTVIATWDASRRLLNARAAVLTAALIGFGPFALRYSNEAKQYGFDVFVSAALLWIVSLSAAPPARLLPATGMIGAGVIAIFASTPSIFVLGGIWAFYASSAIGREKSKKPYVFLAASGLSWVGVFAAVYEILLLRNVDDYLYRYWAPLQLSGQSSALGVLNLVAHGFLDPFLSLDSRIPTLLYVFACIHLLAGGYAIARVRSPRFAVLLTVPLVLTVGAAVIDKWYLSARLMMFTVPLCALLVTASVCWMAALVSSQWSRPLFIGTALLLVAFPLKGTAYYLRHPQIQNLRSAVEFCRERFRPGDTIYVFARSMPGWIFYSMDWSRPDLVRYRWLKTASEATGPNAGNIPPRGHRVVSEGQELRRPYGAGGIELVGIGEGVFRTIGSSPDAPADPGWADNEVRRVLETHGRRVVILASITHERNLSALVDCLTSAGARTVAGFQKEAGRAAIMDLPEWGTAFTGCDRE